MTYHVLALVRRDARPALLSRNIADGRNLERSFRPSGDPAWRAIAFEDPEAAKRESDIANAALARAPDAAPVTRARVWSRAQVQKIWPDLL